MDEKVLVEGEYKIVQRYKLWLAIFSIATLVSFILSISFREAMNTFRASINTVNPQNKINLYGTLWHNFGLFAAIFFVVAIILLCIVVYMSKIKITVTDKKVYGVVGNKQVDLPLDSISSVETGALNSISVSTASGNVSFVGLSNRDAVHSAISKLLVERQGKEKNVNAVVQSSADELKKYKELLDSNIISQEEFDAKKKQLLDL